jgi:(5-formylfuran-3-yl)methyl phosphate synthase
MRLLVSVATAAEAAAALAGGADIIDAKDPRQGALGAVSMTALRGIRTVVGGRCPLSAALGDATDELAIEQLARAFTASGARFVKVGFAGSADSAQVAALTARAVFGAGVVPDGGVIAVAYADANGAPGSGGERILDAAADAGAVGILIDTSDKDGPGLRGLVAPAALTAWVARAHRAGLIAAVAGKLTKDDLLFARDAGADIAGVRGAACEAGRTGRVSAEKVRELMSSLRAAIAWNDTRST